MASGGLKCLEQGGNLCLDGRRYRCGSGRNHSEDGEQRFLDPYPADLRLNGVPVAGGDVSFLELFPDGAGIAYRSDEMPDEKFELFTTDLRIFGDGFERGNLGAWGDLP